jgi:uncharacterized membrane protein YdjX (TVP38/TMEM64 family)
MTPSRGSREPRERSAVRRLLERARSGTGIRVETVLLAAAAVAAVALSPRLRGLEQLALGELSELGPLAPVVLVACYVVVSVLALPAFPLDVAAGAHFGFLEGCLWVQVAATAGSITGYLFGRLLLRGFADRMMERRPKLLRVQAAVELEGWKVVFLTRLSPLFSFSLLSMFYGAARVPLVPYVLATFVGVLPGTALYVYAGKVAGDLAVDGAGAAPAGGWLLEGLCFALTAAIVVIVTRRASRLLRARVDEEQDGTR